MAKIFKTTKDVADTIEDVFGSTGLDAFLNLRIMSLTKAKDIVKITKASAATEFLTNSDCTIQVFVYEAAFDRLTDPQKVKLIEGAFSNVYYDSEKDKVSVDNSQYGEILRMRQKYEDYVDLIETGQLLIQQIDEEEKERKAAEKEAKKNNQQAE